MMLKLENVQKYYGTFLALEIPSLLVDRGIWWVQGENGSGKTTLLKMIAGMLPFTGNITLQEKFTIKKHRQQFVSLVNYAEAEPLYPFFLTAQDLIELYCYTKKGDILHAQELLKQLHVFDAYKQKIGSYSTGMIKKLSLTLAFIGKPALILLDEPLITIDAKAVNVICHSIQEYYRAGVSFIITSHQSVNAEQLDFTGKVVAENKTIKKSE